MDMCSNIASRRVVREDLVMRRGRHWHMRRPGDADGLLAGRETGCATTPLRLAHGSRDAAPRQPATLKVERSLSSSTIFIEHSVNVAAIN